MLKSAGSILWMISCVQAIDFWIINNTPWSLEKLSGSPPPYQMDKWIFPETIGAGVARADIVDQRGIGTTSADDAAHASYVFNGTSSKFDFFFHGGDPPTLKLTFDSIHALGIPSGTTIELPLVLDPNNRKDTFLLLSASQQEVASGPDESNLFITNKTPVGWMHSIFDYILCLPLREVVVPGTHDSGMSTSTDRLSITSPAQVETQTLSLGDQLKYGARYFDLRPTLFHGTFYTGHYSHTAAGWFGANGQSFADMIDEINAFTKDHKEVVILDLTHGYDRSLLKAENTEDGEVGLTQAAWESLFDILTTQLNSRLLNYNNIKDISILSMAGLINGRSSVIIRVGALAVDTQKSVDTLAYKSKGIFSDKEYPLYNDYTGSTSDNEVRDDQVKKLAEQRKERNSTSFLLSWTLTPSDAQEILSLFDENGGPIAISKYINLDMPKTLFDHMTEQSYPNILMVDAYPDDTYFAALAIAIMLKFAGQC